MFSYLIFPQAIWTIHGLTDIHSIFAFVFTCMYLFIYVHVYSISINAYKFSYLTSRLWLAHFIFCKFLYDDETVLFALKGPTKLLT